MEVTLVLRDTKEAHDVKIVYESYVDARTLYGENSKVTIKERNCLDDLYQRYLDVEN